MTGILAGATSEATDWNSGFRERISKAPALVKIAKEAGGNSHQHCLLYMRNWDHSEDGDGTPFWRT